MAAAAGAGRGSGSTAGSRAGSSGRMLAELLAAKEMVVVCGSGGTGKTTVAAALGAQVAATLGGKVLVLTVDPARRLATAMGLEQLGHSHVRVSDDALAAHRAAKRGRTAGATKHGATGELWVAMLDTKAGWDELIERHAPDAAVRDRVLANPLYRNITGRFVNSHDYLAMEQLHELHASGRYDLVIIDTPPSRNALDLLDAPARMREFFGSRLLRWLTVPYRSRLFTFASKPFYQVADRVLGSRFLEDIAEFFVLFQTMEKGFVARAREVERLLSDEGTAFVVVTTAETAPLREARFLADALHRRGMPLGAVVLNRVLPGDIRQPSATKAAAKLADAAADQRTVGKLAKALAVDDPEVLAAVLARVADGFHDSAVVAAREAERRRELEAMAPLVAVVPALADDVHDLVGLARVGRELFR